MKTTVKLFGVRSGRHFPDPSNRKGFYSIEGHIPVEEVVTFQPKERGGTFPWQNPRMRLSNNNIAELIKQTLDDEPESFCGLNRGITIVAGDAELSKENSNGEKTLTITVDDTREGLLDGGTTTGIIIDSLQDGQITSALVKITVLCGPYGDDEITALSEALNTSEQVRESDLANHRGDYNKLKEILARPELSRLKVGYFDGDKDNKVDYNVVEIIQLLNLFVPMDANTDEWDASTAYCNKAGCVANFCGRGKGTLDTQKAQKEQKATFEEMFGVLPSLLMLFERIPERMPELYTATGGRFGALAFIKQSKKIHVLPFTGAKINYAPKTAWVYPILAALRPCLIKRGGSYAWKCDPFKVIEAEGAKLFKVIVDQYHEHKDKLAAAARKPSLYRDLANRVEMAIIKNPSKFEFSRSAVSE